MAAAAVSTMCKQCSAALSRQPAGRRLLTHMPMVIDNSSGHERAMDIWSMLLQKRIVFLQGEVTEAGATALIAQLVYLESVKQSESISMYINSPGGSVSAGLAIYDTMNYIASPVETLVIGQAASMASLLLCAGAPGGRSALPNSRIMMHQPMGGTQGQASDIAIQAEQIQRAKQRIIDIYAKHTRMHRDEIAHKIDRDFWLTPHEAMQHGLLDRVFDKRETDAGWD